MKNELQVKVIEWLQSAAESIGNFATEQIPPFIHEYLSWKFMEAGVDIGWFFIKIVLVFIITFSVYKVGKNKHKKLIAAEKKNWSVEDECHVILPYVVSGLMFITTFCTSLAHFPKEEIKDMLQIKYAPKVYLVEKCSELIKK